VVNHAERSDVVICPAPTIRALLLSYGIQRPIEIVPNAIDLSAFEHVAPGDLRARLGIGPRDRVAIYCGRLAKEKNLPFMLHALRRVLLEAPERRLMLVGEGTEQEDLMALAQRLDLGDRVLFPGRIEYAEIPRYYAAADLFVMTSVTEVRPLALIEAMASGLPVVAVSAPGSADTVTSGADGLLTPEDPVDFAEAVRRVLTDDATRLEMGRRARETAGTYSILDTTRRLVEIYEQVRESRLAANPGGGG
jgi:glycosyltransferase involved in cell wall biosynthesis